MAIFNSYVKLPEGTTYENGCFAACSACGTRNGITTGIAVPYSVRVALIGMKAYFEVSDGRGATRQNLALFAFGS